MEYSYSFSEELQQEWNWSERYAGQPEILRYANHVADRFSLRSDIEFCTEVRTSCFNAKSSQWSIETDNDETLTCQFLVMATGCLSSTNRPEFAGLSQFQGKVLHTGEWPKEGVDFQEQRVGIIGTGSSAIQSIPHIAEECAHLSVFQRTPNFSIPAQNKRLSVDEAKRVKGNYAEFRRQIYDRRPVCA